MYFSITSKSTHVIALVGVTVCVASIVVYGFMLREVTQQRTKLSETQALSVKIERQKQSYQSLLTQLADSKDARALLKSRILTDEGVIDFLSLIENAGREHQVVLKTNTITTQPINNTFETVVINVSVEGAYAPLVRLLTLFEQLPYQAGLHNVVFMHSSEGKEDVWKSTYDIHITKYKAYAN